MWGGGCWEVGVVRGVVRCVWGGECVGGCGCGEVSVSGKVGLGVERWCECGCGEVVGVLI